MFRLSIVWCRATPATWSFIPDESIHLVVTSPPYWTLKRYNDSEGQLGHVADYENSQRTERVWREAFRVLVPGGRLVCVVGDVCLSRRENNGRHTVVPFTRKSACTAAASASTI